MEVYWWYSLTKLSSWQGGGEDSWYDFGKLSKYRTIKNPEWSAKYGETANVYYLISVDVGRKHDQTVVTVFRVNIRDGRYYCTVVYIEVLGLTAERRTFTQQSIDLKRIISRFNPREVVIDVNGLGRPVPKQIFWIAGTFSKNQQQNYETFFSLFSIM